MRPCRRPGCQGEGAVTDGRDEPRGELGDRSPDPRKRGGEPAVGRDAPWIVGEWHVADAVAQEQPGRRRAVIDDRLDQVKTAPGEHRPLKPSLSTPVVLGGVELGDERGR